MAALVGVTAMRWLHYGCDWSVGGEAGSGAWLCPDGNAYAIPALVFGAVTSALVLVVEEVRRRRR